jgi:hypothetical protein
MTTTTTGLKGPRSFGRFDEITYLVEKSSALTPDAE